MSCAPWLSRTRRGGRNAAAAGVVVAGVRRAGARSADKAQALWNGEEQKEQQYQRLLSLPSAAVAGTQQQGGRLSQRKHWRGQRKPPRGVEEDPTAAANRDCSLRATGSPEAANEEDEGHTCIGSLLSFSKLPLHEQTACAQGEQRRATASNAGNNDKSRNSGTSGTVDRRSSGRRSNRVGGNSRSRTGSPPAAARGGERINGSIVAQDPSGATTTSCVSPPAVATVSGRATTSAVTHGAQATTANAATATGGRAAAGKALDSSSRCDLILTKHPGTYSRHHSGALKRAPRVPHEFRGEHRQFDMAESVSPSRDRSRSIFSTRHGQLGSLSSEVSDSASEETAALPAAAEDGTVRDARGSSRAAEGATSAPEAAISTTVGRTHRGDGGNAMGRGYDSSRAAADCGEYEDGRDSRFASGRGSHYSRHSVLPGRRRTGRLTERWSSVFLRSRRSTLADDSMPSVLPMSETDWIIVDRLSRKTNSSNFATVLKAYLIIKTRIAAQRANKEYAQSQRKGRPGAALRLLLQRQNNRVALRVRAAEAGAGAAAAAGPPSAADVATTAEAVFRVEAAAAEMDRERRRRRGRGSEFERTGSDSPVRGNSSSNGGEQQDMAAAVRVAASAGGGSIVGCGMMAETPDVSLSSASFAGNDSSAAGHSRTPPRQEQNRIAGLKGVGDVGRMQAHQSLLEQRLAFLGLRSVCIRGDGNCLFRSCSYNLYGSEEYHRYVRLHATQHMRSGAYRKDYAIFFEGESEFDTYLKNMQRPGTWGDELCVRAIADSFECTIHIITSTDSNWYLRYDPQISSQGFQGEEQDEEDDAEHAGQSAAVALMQPVKAVRHIFLTYISPIHYNAFTIAEEDQ